MTYHKNNILFFCVLLVVRDEELLKQGLELNDRLQSVLTKHDAIASGSPLPVETPSRELRREDPNPDPSTPITHDIKAQVEEDEDDEFAQIARRYVVACKRLQTVYTCCNCLLLSELLIIFYVFAEKTNL